MLLTASFFAYGRATLLLIPASSLSGATLRPPGLLQSPPDVTQPPVRVRDDRVEEIPLRSRIALARDDQYFVNPGAVDASRKRGAKGGGVELARHVLESRDAGDLAVDHPVHPEHPRGRVERGHEFAVAFLQERHQPPVAVDTVRLCHVDSPPSCSGQFRKRAT